MLKFTHIKIFWNKLMWMLQKKFDFFYFIGTSCLTIFCFNYIFYTFNYNASLNYYCTYLYWRCGILFMNNVGEYQFENGFWVLYLIFLTFRSSYSLILFEEIFGGWGVAIILQKLTYFYTNFENLANLPTLFFILFSVKFFLKNIDVFKEINLNSIAKIFFINWLINILLLVFGGFYFIYLRFCLFFKNISLNFIQNLKVQQLIIFYNWPRSLVVLGSKINILDCLSSNFVYKILKDKILLEIFFTKRKFSSSKTVILKKLASISSYVSNLSCSLFPRISPISLPKKGSNLANYFYLLLKLIWVYLHEYFYYLGVLLYVRICSIKYFYFYNSYKYFYILNNLMYIYIKKASFLWRPIFKRTSYLGLFFKLRKGSENSF